MPVLVSTAVIAALFALGTWWFSAWRTARMLDAQSRPLREPVLQARLDLLARALDLPSLPVHVFDVDQVNGFAAPDGRVFLTRGFLHRYRQGQVTADELAGVVAHELGHVALGHARRRMIDMTGQNAVFAVLAAVLGRVIPFVGVWVAQIVATALAAGLSRTAEHEADAYASALLVRAGIGTAPQKSLFAKLERLTGGGAGAPAWLRSHPDIADRIARIEARERRWGLG